MAARKQLYVRDEAQDLWKRAEELLKASGESISTLVERMLSDWVERKEEATQNPSRIVVSVYDAKHDVGMKKAFNGHWLVKGFYDESEDAVRGLFDVAETAGKQFAVITHDSAGRQILPMRFDVYASLDDLADAATDEMVPESLVSAVADAIGEEYIEELDI